MMVYKCLGCGTDLVPGYHAPMPPGCSFEFKQEVSRSTSNPKTTGWSKGTRESTTGNDGVQDFDQNSTRPHPHAQGAARQVITPPHTHTHTHTTLILHITHRTNDFPTDSNDPCMHAYIFSHLYRKCGCCVGTRWIFWGFTSSLAPCFFVAEMARHWCVIAYVSCCLAVSVATTRTRCFRQATVKENLSRLASAAGKRANVVGFAPRKVYCCCCCCCCRSYFIFYFFFFEQPHLIPIRQARLHHALYINFARVSTQGRVQRLVQAAEKVQTTQTPRPSLGCVLAPLRHIIYLYPFPAFPNPTHSHTLRLTPSVRENRAACVELFQKPRDVRPSSIHICAKSLFLHPQ